jgi:hypothetical protein
MGDRSPKPAPAGLASLIAGIAASVGIVVGRLAPWLQLYTIGASGLDFDGWGNATLTLGAVSGIALVTEREVLRTRSSVRWAAPLAFGGYLGPVVSGAHSLPYVIHTGQQASLLGVKFTVGCAREVPGVALDVLGNTHVALADIWGSCAFALQESVMTATTVQERFTRVEAMLTARVLEGRGAHPAIAGAVCTLAHTAAPSPVTHVACESQLSTRRFIEVFRRDVGMAPKLVSE